MNNADADKSHRGNAGQFYVAAELCRRGYMAVVTMGNCPNTDVLVSNKAGTKFAHVQVKTFVPGSRTCSVGLKAERDFGERFFWVLAGLPKPAQAAEFIYFVVPAAEMALRVAGNHQVWLKTPGKKGQKHSESNKVRAVHLPPRADSSGWNLAPYQDCWNLIEKTLT